MLRELLDYKREQRGVEFKAAGSLTDSDYRARVIRAVMGMANRRDGGTVILGVDDASPASSPGVTDVHASQWSQFDDVADKLATYADPVPEFVIEVVELDGLKFVVISVAEFSTTPVLCKKAYQTQQSTNLVLRSGACYVRSASGKIETKEITTAAEMRELIDLAAEKRLRDHIAMTSRAGGAIFSISDANRLAATAGFDAELGDLA